MTHITSDWAHRYGLPDPADTAADIKAADPEIPATAHRLLNSVTLALRFGREHISVARVTVESGWSTVSTHNAARSLTDLSVEVEARIAVLSAAMTELEAAVRNAHRQVATAYDGADTAIRAMYLEWSSSPGDFDALARLDRERSALVWNLHVTIRAIAGALDAAASASSGAMDTPPDTALPAAPPGMAAAASLANIARLRADLSSTDFRRRFAGAIDHALHQARAAGLEAQLLTYDPGSPDGQGGVAIAIGDVSNATSVAVLVPGVGNSPVDIARSFDAAAAVNAAADNAGGIGSRTATILWFGYDIPLSWTHDQPPGTARAIIQHAFQDSLLAVDSADAELGGLSLALFVRNLVPFISRSANLTLIGHSYGSTTVAQAARHIDKGSVDDIVLLGSPGVGFGINGADSLRAVDADHVYSMAFPFDPVPAVGQSGILAALNPAGQIARQLTIGKDLGPFGPDPVRPAFGANVIDVRSNAPIAGPVDVGQHALSNYLSGSSLAAVGAVSAARYERIPVLPKE